jgi:ORF6N domain
MPQHTLALSPSAIAPKVHWIRHEKVILDFDLATLYGVETRVLKQAVRRNRGRFPEDFLFVLTTDETGVLVSQSVIPGRSKFGGAAPYAFIEQGVAMLSSVLRSTRAPGQHRHHAHLRPVAPAHGLQPRPGSQN